MTILVILFLALTAGVAWSRVAGADGPDYSHWGGGVPAGSAASTRLVHDERRRRAA